MKLRIAIGIVGLLLVFLSEVPFASAAFRDVSGDHLHYEAVSFLEAEEIVQGYANGNFNPEGGINRAEFLKMLISVNESSRPTLSIQHNCFSDVREGSWYASFICSAKARGIVGGYPDGSFKPEQAVSFAEAAKMTTTAFALSTPPSSTPSGRYDQWYERHVELLGFHKAIPRSVRAFDQLLSRGQTAEIFFRLSERRTDKRSKTLEDLSKHIVLVVGEPGESGTLFIQSAQTFQREFGGEILEFYNGDQFVHRLKELVAQRGPIDHLEYFGHGNNRALFLAQRPRYDGSVYSNDPERNRDFPSASIYELPENLFVHGGTARFNGCNIAKGFPDEDNLAQRIANYFDIEVYASKGPTLFDERPEGVYMVPSYSYKGFVTVSPRLKSPSGYKDVYEGQEFEEAIRELKKRGLSLPNADGNFIAYKTLTAADAQAICQVAKKEGGSCHFSGYDPAEWIRNLDALKMLYDAAGVSVQQTEPAMKGYIWWGNKHGLLTEDFTDKYWYSRGEMAQLTWNLIQKREE